MITISDWAIVTATGVGPLIAVLTSLWIEARRAKKAARRALVQTFLHSMHTPGDPAYQAAVGAVAVEFRKDPEVMRSHREFLDAANLGPNAGTSGLTSQKLVKLVTILFRRIGSRVSEDDVRGMGFVSVGYVERERRLEATLLAVVRVADALEAQLAILKQVQTPPGSHT